MVSDESARLGLSEIWKDIKGYEGLYQVSSFGRVRSKRRRGSKGGIAKLTLDKKNTDYFKIRLCKNNHYRAFFVHRLVAQAFIPNPNGYPQVNHKDEDRHNNFVNNLEWCTNRYNSNYKNHNWKNSISQKGRKWVYQYSLFGDVIARYKTVSEAAEAMHGSSSNISHAAHRKGSTAYGYVWKYAD